MPLRRRNIRGALRRSRGNVRFDACDRPMRRFAFGELRNLRVHGAVQHRQRVRRLRPELLGARVRERWMRRLLR